MSTTRNGVGPSIFGGSFSVVHCQPAQEVPVHERVGGMLDTSNSRAGQSGSRGVSLVLTKLRTSAASRQPQGMVECGVLIVVGDRSQSWVASYESLATNDFQQVALF